MTDPRLAWRVVEDFERALCEYTGAPHAVAVDSATNALFLCFRSHLRQEGRDVLFLPAHTYVGVIQAAKRAGLWVELREIEWDGEYEILPTKIVDAAKWFRRGMYRTGTHTCLSFQAYKQLPIGRGGAILCDDAEDAEWFRRASYDGRIRGTPIALQESFDEGWHMYLGPDAAARGLWLMNGLAENAKPIGSWRDYPDLRQRKLA